VVSANSSGGNCATSTRTPPRAPCAGRLKEPSPSATRASPSRRIESPAAHSSVDFRPGRYETRRCAPWRYGMIAHEAAVGLRSACCRNYLSYAPAGLSILRDGDARVAEGEAVLQSTLRKELAAFSVLGRAIAGRCCSLNTTSLTPPRLSSRAPTIGQRCSAWTAWASGQRRPRGLGDHQILTPAVGRSSFLHSLGLLYLRVHVFRDSE